MTFDEWWKVMKPAECDEVKEYFVEAYQIGFNQGYGNGVAVINEAVKLERKTCAELCEELETDMGHGVAQRCAEKIRARGK